MIKYGQMLIELFVLEKFNEVLLDEWEYEEDEFPSCKFYSSDIQKQVSFFEKVNMLYQ